MSMSAAGVALGAQRIADILGISRRRVAQLAAEEAWFFKVETGKGGRQNLYFVSSLPDAIKGRIVEHLAREAADQAKHAGIQELTQIIDEAGRSGAALPLELRRALCERELACSIPASVVSTPRGLSEAQRQVAEARLTLLREIDRLALRTSAQMAIATLADLAESGRLSPRLMALVPVANARDGAAQRALSVRTLYRWRSRYKAGGFDALAPADVGDNRAPWWAEGFLRHYQNPNKPSLTLALRAFRMELRPTGVPAPSYDQVKTFVRKLGTVERHRGRMGPRELKNLKSYVKRDDAKLDPLDVVLIDGHTFDAEVAHPDHGGPFRPEITTLIDFKTRVVLGYSLGLAESAQAVTDAIRHAVLRHGIMALLYTDHGSGYEAAAVSSVATGLLTRLGVTHTQSIPYNSQARGRSERSHATIWVEAAQLLPTFVGAKKDPEDKKKIHKLTRKDFARGKRHPILMAWRDFVGFASATVDSYNDRPHRGLPKIVDRDTGRNRHQSPNECMRAAIEAGFVPERVSQSEADQLFRPHVEVRTRRGTVTLRGLQYFSEELVEHGGDRVQVAYEPADPSFVWVKTLEGRPICKAPLEGHKRDAFPESMTDMARRDRVMASIARKERDIEKSRLELPGAVMDAEPHQITAEQEASADAVIVQFRPAPVAEPAPLVRGRRPEWFGSDREKIDWMTENPDLVEAADLQWFDRLCDKLGDTFKAIYGENVELITLARRKNPAG